jgi:hypothetical protein
MVEVIVNSTILDLSDDIPLALNLSIADIREPEKRQQSFSKTITVPASDTNNKLFTHAFNVSLRGHAS